MMRPGGITRRSASDIAAMRRAGQVVAEMHERTRAALRPGVTTGELDRIGREVLADRGATSNFLGVGGTYPAVICASPNEVVVHGIPGDRVLEEGDIVSVDCGAVVDGWHGDAAYTAGIGEISAEARRLIEVTEASLAAAIARMVPGGHLGDIGFAVESVVEAAGLHVVDGYTGHGIGRAMHEEPQVPNWGEAGRGKRLKAGLVIAIEPMVNAGAHAVEVLEDNWTAVTKDRSLSAHFEHTIAITDEGPWVLSRAGSTPGNPAH
jgi:methionyl aminopeptidase